MAMCAISNRLLRFNMIQVISQWYIYNIWVQTRLFSYCISNSVPYKNSKDVIPRL